MKEKFSELKTRFFKLGKKKRIFISILAIYLIIIPVILFAVGKNNSSNVLGSDNVDAEGRPLNVIDQIGTLTQLPTEEPLVSTIENASSLQDQIFFKKAQNGDILLIFKENKRGVIYRPSSNQIIENTTIDVVAETKTMPQVTETNNPNYQRINNTNVVTPPTPEVSPISSIVPTPIISN